jgi:hypothetical protein
MVSLENKNDTWAKTTKGQPLTSPAVKNKSFILASKQKKVFPWNS